MMYKNIQIFFITYISIYNLIENEYCNLFNSYMFIRIYLKNNKKSTQITYILT